VTYLFILNTELGAPIDFNAFRSVAPNGSRATFNWFASKLGDGTTISRPLVQSFSLAAVKRHTIYRKFASEPDNPFAFLLNLPNDMISFKDFLSVAPMAVLVNDAGRIPRRELLKTYKYLCRVLGNGTVIYRHAVVAFSLSKMKKHVTLLQQLNQRAYDTCHESTQCSKSDDNKRCGCYKISGLGWWCQGLCYNGKCDHSNPCPCDNN
jgi:hypothetical protein